MTSDLFYQEHGFLKCDWCGKLKKESPECKSGSSCFFNGWTWKNDRGDEVTHKCGGIMKQVKV